MSLFRKAIGVGLALCLLLPLQTQAAQALAGAAGGEFARTVNRAWELARGGQLDAALAVVEEARSRTTDPTQAGKLAAMVKVYTMMKTRTAQRAGAAAPPASPAAQAAAQAEMPSAQAAADAPRTWGLRLGRSASRARTWEYSAGLAMRTGGEVTFASRPLVRPDGGQYVNGIHTDGGNFLIEGDQSDAGSANPTNPTAQENVSPQLDLIGWQTVDPNGVPNSGDETYYRNVTYDRSSLTGSNADLENGVGLSLEASRRLDRGTYMPSHLTFGLGIFKSDSQVTATQGQGVGTTTLTGILYKEGGAVPPTNQPRTPYQEVGGVVRQTGGTNYGMTDNLFEMGGAQTTDTTVEMGAESLLFVLSLGAQYDADVAGWFTVFASAGPTVNVVLAETSVEQRATWNASASPLDGQAVQGFSDSQSESAFGFALGAFAAVGARAQIGRRVAVDLCVRYDKSFGTVDVGDAEFDLDGVGGELRLVFTF